MTPAQLAALQRYISAVAYFMLHQLGAPEYLAARKHLEDSFKATLPVPPTRDFPYIL